MQFRSTKVRLSAAAFFSLCCLPVSAQADTISITETTYVFYGTALNIVAVETSSNGGKVLTSPSDTGTPLDPGIFQSIMTNYGATIGSNVAAQLAADPQAISADGGGPGDVPIPLYVRNALAGFASVNGLGFDATISPDPALAAFNASLPQPLSEADFVVIDNDLAFTYAVDLPASQETGGLAVSVFDNINFVEATPLPATLPLFASALGVMGLLGRRKRKTTTAA